MSSHLDIKHAIDAVTAKAKELEPSYEERLEALRAYKSQLLEAKRNGLSARQIHEELAKNLSFHITYKVVLTVLHEAEQELNGAAAKRGGGKNGGSVVSKKTRSRQK